MICPQFDEALNILNSSKAYTIIPVYKEIFADTRTSVELLKILLEQSKKSFLLESMENSRNWGRYSFLGYCPKQTIRCKNRKIFIDNSDKAIDTENPNQILREILAKYKSPKIDSLPVFTGGFVGYFSFDCVKYYERSLNLDNINQEDFDDFELMLFDKVIAFDHLKQKIFIIINVECKDFKENYSIAVKEIEVIEALIKNGISQKTQQSKLKSDFKELHSKNEFIDMISKVKEHIKEGDIFQAVLSNRFEASFEGSLLQSYRVLRTINPSPYMFYINFDNLEITGASPETLITLSSGKLSNYALAGTCKRGETLEEDNILINKLLNDEKELAEHNMLVDLARNDLGKISDFGSVKVSEYKKIVQFSYVSHMASLISGNMKKDCDQFDALAAVLPAGTLSGAPKKRACEIINSLEKHKRGIYGGAIGYIDFAGNMDMCIAIRMALSKNGKVFIQSGAGIVADSIPEKEFNECRQKAQGLIDALKLASEGYCE
jgi:anthranilate synthase component 1